MNRLSYLLMIFCGWLLICPAANSQTVVGMGTDNPNPNAVLELVSENQNQGLLVPRLSTQQRIAVSFTSKLTNADNGLLVFDTDEGVFYHWYDGTWRAGTSSTLLQNNTLPQDKIFVGNASGMATPVSISGDISLNSDGTMTIRLDAVTTSKILNNAITTAKIADDAVTKDKINADVAGDGLAQQADGSLEINVSGNGLEIVADQLQLGNTNNGELLIGDGTQVNSQMISGDMSLTGTGTARVTGLQGNPVETTIPVDGDVLTWNGSSWVPASTPLGVITMTKGSAWYAGISIPDATNPNSAVDGDFYYRTNTEVVYRRQGGVWVELGKWVKPSGDTVRGATITATTTPTLYIGTGNPNNGSSNNGQPGDLYFDQAGNDLYIKESTTQWHKF